MATYLHNLTDTTVESLGNWQLGSFERPSACLPVQLSTIRGGDTDGRARCPGGSGGSRLEGMAIRVHYDTGIHKRDWIPAIIMTRLRLGGFGIAKDAVERADMA